MNLRHTVLETAALPLSYTPKYLAGSSFPHSVWARRALSGPRRRSHQTQPGSVEPKPDTRVRVSSVALPGASLAAINPRGGSHA